MAMPSKLTCPACGSDSISTSYRDAEIEIPYARPAQYSAVSNVCGVCGTEGDFLGENDSRVAEAIKTSTRESVRSMIDQLAEAGVSMAYIERVLGLPQRTMARWKAGEVSSPAVALLRLVSTYPWLLSVAEESFEFSFAQQKLIEEASRALHEFVRRRKVSVFVSQPSSQVTQASSAGEPASSPRFSLVRAG
jgi:transcriptional regulator with XRE-family HTH domain